MTTTISPVRCSAAGQNSLFGMSAARTSSSHERIHGPLSAQSVTSITKRKVSFDDCGGMSNDDLDVTSRFLSSQYTTSTTTSSIPQVSAVSKRTESSHDMPCKSHSSVATSATMSRLSRSGCLCLLDGEGAGGYTSTPAKRRRSINGTAIPSVSEENMTLGDSSTTLYELQQGENVQMDDIAASMSLLSPIMSQVQVQLLQVQAQTEKGEEKSDNNNHQQHQHQHQHDLSIQPSYWGHYVDFLSPEPEEESKAEKYNYNYKRGSSFQKTRYHPYHSKTLPVKLKDESFQSSNPTDDDNEEKLISRAIERIQRMSLV
mmetsp:Transcript_4525/g.8709  ORF Transcript_4525/g.8709 Transcript_4525/m.8709 type:complete len:316 (+) Transcript_4525:399-1346(+)|eukprot:CAMPEP_0176496022 /NCGR_PEP_ID=MMETSP0200_2-20121128/10978_1 /TAXON_ID=947934 /ORGANISM="Chaetoceros sp., Strain GSL56" /LENGTH=315 /DNA_ID=CAMNT_0017893959 /DNA_START=316 /DNA_END=1263 /DNA_ORIENTATION=+